MLIGRKKPTYDDLKDRVVELEALVADLRGNGNRRDHDASKLKLTVKEGELPVSRQAEQIFKESRELQRIFVDASPDIYFFKDMNFRYVILNKASESFFGMDESAMLGKTDFDVLPEEVAMGCRITDQEALDKNRLVVNEEIIGEKTYETRKVPVLVGDEIVGVAGIVQDITQRKQAENELESYGNLLDSILKASAAGIAYVKNRKIEWANDALGKIFRFSSKKEYIGKDTSILYFDEDEYNRVGKIIYDSPENSTIEIDARFKRWDTGAEFFALVKINKLDPADMNAGIIVTITDITARKRAEESLRESEQFFRAIIESSKDANIAVGGDGLISIFNPAAEKMFGRTASEMIGKTLDPLMPEEYRERHRNYIAGFFKNGHSNRAVNQTIELPALRNDGTVFPIELSLSTGNVRGQQFVLSNIRDITDRKKAEEEQAKTAKLESIGVLAGGIAHDFNNILTAVLGNINLARMIVDQDMEKAKEVLYEAEKASYRAKKLTGQLLTFSKGGAPIKSTFNLTRLVESTVEFVLHGSKVKGEFEYLGEHLDLPMNADEGQVGQVINNVVINAVQAMPAGGKLLVRLSKVRFAARNRRGLKNGDYILISIKDQGVGIAAGDLSKIFDPYFTTKESCSGLGLTTSYSIVKRHEGCIDVESEVGAGTTVHIFLPAAEDIQEKSEVDRNSREAFKKSKILIMDDERAILSLASDMLKYIGHDVEVANDGKVAVKHYEKALESGRPFDAVILDLTNPGGMGGLDTIAALKEIDPDVKAIISSGYSDEPCLSEPQKYGFRGFISKPFKTKDLMSVLQGVLAE